MSVRIYNRLLDKRLFMTSTRFGLITQQDLKIELAPVKSDLTILKWMLGFLLGDVLTLLLKAFLP